MTKLTIKDYIVKYSKEKSYFHLGEVKYYLVENQINFKQDTLKKYIYILKKEKKLYSAGKGWYSTIEKEFKLDKQPIENIVQLIHSKYPLLDFSCWSTEQIKGYFQHLPSQFVTFIYSDIDYLSTIKEFLIEKNYNVYLNPHKQEIEKFVELKNRTNIILRPSILGRIIRENSFDRIEKILVDLFIEIERINLINQNEYLEIIANILLNNRINISEMIDYAYNRKIVSKINKILKEVSEIH